MATLAEQYALRRGTDGDNLRTRVSAALAVKAAALIALATPTAKQMAWALETIGGPDAKAQPFLDYLIAANSGLSAGQIAAVPDANLQTAVNAAVDKLTA